LTTIEYTQYSDTNSGDAEGINENGKIKLRLEKTFGLSANEKDIMTEYKISLEMLLTILIKILF
jgi:hypothetical protein